MFSKVNPMSININTLLFRLIHSKCFFFFSYNEANARLIKELGLYQYFILLNDWRKQTVTQNITLKKESL